MSESWAAVDHLLESFLLPQDEALSAALAAAEQAGLPPIQVPPVQGRFLHLLARSIGARRVLEFFSEKTITTPVIRIGWPDQFIEHASTQDELRKKYGLSVENTVAKVKAQFGETTSKVTQLVEVV